MKFCAIINLIVVDSDNDYFIIEYDKTVYNDKQFYDLYTVYDVINNITHIQSQFYINEVEYFNYEKKLLFFYLYTIIINNYVSNN